jgi:hypothetical protein
MHLVYIDESGDTTPISQNGSRYFTLSAYIVDEKDRKSIEIDLRNIKHEFYQNPDIEFKSNFIRYANPDIRDADSPLKLHSRERYNNLEEKLATYLKAIPGIVLAVVIDKNYYWNQYPAQNPYDAAYMFLLERVQMYLSDVSALGIVIIDPREGRVEKKFVGDNLEHLHHKMRFTDSKLWQINTTSIVERLLYSDSASTIGIQLADLFCYPIFHIFEYKKAPKDYWRFVDISSPKMYRPDGVLLGRGLKIFPDETKNGLE